MKFRPPPSAQVGRVKRNLGFLSNNLPFRASSGLAPYADPVDGWVTRVIAAGGTVSANTIAAAETLVTDLFLAGVWDKINRLNLFAGDQLAAALVPIKVGAGNPVDTNVNFVAGDYSELTGLTGNGVNKYLRTGLIPSGNLTLNNTHLAVYNRAPNEVGGQIGIGANDGGGVFQIYSPLSTGSFFSDQYNSSGAAGRVSGAVVAPYRLLVAARTAANSHVIYRDGAAVATSATSGGNLPAVEFYIFATNSSGAANQFTAMPYASYSIGDGLSVAEVAAYSTAMQAFQVALGRSV